MDFLSNIGNKRNSRKTNSRRPYTRRTSISSVSSANVITPSSNSSKKEKTLYSLNKLDVFPNYQPQQDSGNGKVLIYILHNKAYERLKYRFTISQTRKVVDRHRFLSFRRRRSRRGRGRRGLIFRSRSMLKKRCLLLDMTINTVLETIGFECRAICFSLG